MSYSSWGRGYTKPPLGAQIDWGHPFAKRNPIGCFIINERGGAPIDLLAKQTSITTYGTWGSNRDGSFVKDFVLANSATANWRSGNNNFGAEGSFTIVAKGFWSGAAPTGFQGGSLIDNLNWTGSADSGFGIEWEYAPNNILFEYWNGGGSYRVRATFAPTLLKSYTIVVRRDATTSKMDLFIDGVLNASMTTAWNPVKDSPAALKLGSLSNSSQANLSYAFLFRGRLTNDEIRWITLEPFSWLKSTPYRRYFTSAAALSFNSYWARNSNTLIYQGVNA